MKKIIVMIMLVAHSAFLVAQNNVEFNFNFNHMALSVKDVNLAVEFYKKVFQLNEITNRSAIEGIRWISMGEGKELHLISVIKEPVTLNKAIHLSLATNKIDEFEKRLIEMQIPYSNWPGKPNTVNTRADGVKQIYFQDPDGYWIEVNNGYSSAASVEQIKNEVWQLEENYWQYVKNKDLKSYLTLWDENFIGYPSTNVIGNKDHITDWITEMYKDKTGTFKYELTRKVENVFGEIVIVLYDVAHSFTDDKREAKKSTFKITHTWKKNDKGWLIIGGMGANK